MSFPKNPIQSLLKPDSLFFIFSACLQTFLFWKVQQCTFDFTSSWNTGFFSEDHRKTPKMPVQHRKRDKKTGWWKIFLWITLLISPAVFVINYWFTQNRIFCSVNVRHFYRLSAKPYPESKHLILWMFTKLSTKRTPVNHYYHFCIQLFILKLSTAIFQALAFYKKGL